MIRRHFAFVILVVAVHSTNTMPVGGAAGEVDSASAAGAAVPDGTDIPVGSGAGGSNGAGSGAVLGQDGSGAPYQELYSRLDQLGRLVEIQAEEIRGLRSSENAGAAVKSEQEFRGKGILLDQRYFNGMAKYGGISRSGHRGCSRLRSRWE